MIDWNKLDEREKLVWSAAFGAYYSRTFDEDSAEYRADGAVKGLRERQRVHDEEKRGGPYR